MTFTRLVRSMFGLAALSVMAAALVFAVPAPAADFVPGSPGLGDPFFPNAGNGGYDVEHYSLTLAYEPSSNQLSGTAVITATATQNLSSFNLDLRGFSISRLLVNGQAASFARDGEHELVITPGTGLRSGSVFTVAIDYAGTPAVVTDPDEAIEGWIPTDDGAFVVGEPQGSPAWYPVNDNPRDKATFDFRVTVPAGLTVMANGVLVSSATAGGKTTWVWQETDPMAPYLATATLGRFDLTVSTTSAGIPTYVAVDPQLPKGQVLGQLPEVVDFSRRSTARIRSTPSERSSTAPRSSATRSRRRRSRCSTGCRTRRRSSTSSPTCGSATRSPSRRGPTSGCTKGSPPGPNGSGASTRATSRRRSG